MHVASVFYTTPMLNEVKLQLCDATRAQVTCTLCAYVTGFGRKNFFDRNVFQINQITEIIGIKM